MEPSSIEPRINLVSLIKRTIGKVLVSAGIEENEGSARMVLTCLVNIASQYNRALEDDPTHVEALFHAFLSGTEEEQRAAVKAYGEAFVPPPEPHSDTLSR